MITPEIRKARMNELRKSGIFMPYLSDDDLAKDFPPTPFLREHVQVAYLYDRPGGRRHEEEYPFVLTRVQEAWDRSKKHVDWRLEQQAQRQAQAAADERAKAEADAARRTAEADQIRADLRERFLSLPGTTPEDFEREFPTLLADHRRREMDRMDDAAEQARQAMAARLRSSF